MLRNTEMESLAENQSLFSFVFFCDHAFEKLLSKTRLLIHRKLADEDALEF